MLWKHLPQIPVASLELLLTSDLHVETDEGEKAKSVKRASVSDGETKANCFQRIWSEEDEIALLQGIVDYKETSGLDPFNGERKALYDLLKPHISVSVTSVQFFQKIRTLKKKFKKEKNKGSKPNNQKLFHLSKLIWGDEEISYAEKDELKTGEGRKRSVFQLWRH
ncbi:transcription factor STKL2-like [Brassica napus]|uniref:transcription factor STKL2-like n=1 Tax=Brassica napus TaxID=3708 RepID=UPI002078E2B1|nr:transcription factor STKL2-like [Brassica napus]